MTDAFYAILKASFQGSIVILAVLALRLLLKRAPKSLFCLLWLLAGLRLVLPFEIQSSFSLQPRLEDTSISVQAEQPVQIPDTLIQNPEGQPQNAPQAPNLSEGNWENMQSVDIPYHVENGTITEPVSYGDIAAQIWLLGVAVMALASLWSYWKLKRRVRMAYLIENGCFECPGLDTAFVLGFFPPKIYLPMDLNDREKKFIFDHENTHIARHDHWFKLLGYAVLSIHWFNPLVWIGYGALCRDMELACDEHVVRHMTLGERKAYSAALLSCGSHTARIAACPVAFGESNPRRRIMNVLNYKRPGFWISLLAVIAVIFVAVCLLTSPGKPSLLEFGNVADEELHVICIGTKNGLTDVSNPDDIREIQKLLKSISWEKDTPTERPDEPDGYVILFNSLLAEDALYFSNDCSLVWAENTKAYPVSDAGKLREYLDTLTEAVWDRETSGEPFADINQPAQWLRGISESAVREAEIYIEQPTVQEGNTSSTTRSMGVLSARDCNVLLDILNGLPESAIVSESTLPRENFPSLRGSLVPHGGMTLTVYDDVNQLVMILRLVKDDVMEFILIDELEKVEGEPAYLDHPRCWIIEDDTLLAFLKQMQAHPMIIYPIEFFEHDSSDAEETEPAWTADMTGEEYLTMCRNAVAELQNREQFHISETLVYYADETEDSRSKVAFWRDGENWLREAYKTRMQVNNDFLYYGGILYRRLQEESSEPAWSRTDGGGQSNGNPWVCLLQWDNQTVTFEAAEEKEDELLVAVIVEGAPPTLGWDDVQSYRIIFFFDKAGNMTQTWMSACKENLRVLSTLTVEATQGSDIHNKLEKVALQRPDAPAANLTDEHWLEKCRTALESYQSQGTWAIQAENSFWGQGALNSGSMSHWFGNGEDYVKWTQIPDDSNVAAWWDLQVNGEAYHRQGWFPKDGSEGTISQWEEGSTDSQAIYPHWPLWYSWNGTDITFVEQGTEDSMEYVTFAVQGEPFPVYPDDIAEYQVTFRFRSDVLHIIELSYQRADSLGGGTRIYDLYFFAPKDVVNRINQCHSEALLHVHGICNDPDCTDMTHDHYGVACTVEHCTNPAHGHSDEHHH